MHHKPYATFKLLVLWITTVPFFIYPMDLVKLHKAIQNGTKAEIEKHLNSATLNRTDNYKNTPLHLAASLGKTNAVKLLLTREALVNEKNIEGLTPLQCAATRGHLAVVKLLISHDCLLNCQTTENSYTALHMASHEGHADVVAYLLAKKASLSLVTKKGFMAFHLAAQNGHCTVLQLLIQAGSPLDAQTLSGSTAMHLAAENGHSETIKLLSQHGLSVNTLTNAQHSPLFTAVGMGHLQAVQTLISRGAHLDTKETILLHRTAQNKNLEVLRFLADQGFDLNAPEPDTGFSIIHIAVLTNNQILLNFLVQQHCNLNILDHDGYAPLHHAARLEHTSLIRTLLSNGADVNIRARNGQTPLYIATEENKLSAVRCLMQAGALTKQVNHAGISPLDCALHANNLHLALILVAEEDDLQAACSRLVHSACLVANHKILAICCKQDINLLAKNNHGLTPLQVAALAGHVTIITHLIKEAGVEVDHANFQNSTALHIAALAGQPESLKILLQLGARVEAQNIDSQTPLHIAALNQNLCCIEILLNAAALSHYSPQKQAELERLMEVLEFGRTRCYPLNTEGKDYGTLLQFADDMGYEAISDYLRNHGVTRTDSTQEKVLTLLKSQDKYGYTPLQYALLAGRTGTIEYCRKWGYHCDMRDNDGGTLLHFAAENCGRNVIEFLLNLGETVDSADSDGNTPLHLAAQNKCPEAAQTLLEHKADINAQNTSGMTPLFIASCSGSHQVLQLLIAHGAKGPVPGEEGLSALHCALARKHLGCVQTLIILDALIDPLLAGELLIRLCMRRGISLRDTPQSTPVETSSFYPPNTVQNYFEIRDRCLADDQLLEVDMNALFMLAVHFLDIPLLSLYPDQCIPLLKAWRDNRGCTIVEVARELHDTEGIKWLQSLGIET